MGARTVAFVMEQTLGSITHYLNLRRYEGVLADCTPRWLPIDYRDGMVPWTITGSLNARRALRPMLDDVDGIFLHTATLAPLMVDLFRHKPAILSADGTPLNKRAMRPAYGLKPENRGAQETKRLLYREVFARARGFVAWSHWAKQSFVEDYGCREEDVAVIPPGIDVDQFSDAVRNNDVPRILFVGGDFQRKGGDLLLKVFRERLRGKAQLTVVTREPVNPERGVRIYRDVAPNSPALLQLYRESDIFVLPTRADCYSLVCMEAMASGLPVVATKVGGIPDILRDGSTGHLLDVDDADQLGDVLESLLAQPERRREMGRLSREDAMNRFSSRDNARKLFEFLCTRF
jgi:glycosyltransferase involved in cell wall biosynthesis